MRRPLRIGLTVPLVFLLMLLNGCSMERDLSDVKRYFERGKFGDSPDVALLKKSILGRDWDHVATIHGMANDMDFCQDLVNALRIKSPREQYSCSMLNH